METCLSRKYTLLRRIRRTLHRVAFGLFHADAQSKQTIGEQVKPKELQWQQWNRLAYKGSQQHHQHLADISRNTETHKLANVVIDRAFLSHRGDDRCKII